ncbi:MAG: GDP-mannose 4,6-dehydratase [Candidatus Nezhaarchaeales archaeon]
MKIENANVLVAGGAGFIGSHLVDRLINEKPQKLVVVDNFYLGEDKIRNLSLAKSRFPSLKIYHQDAANIQVMEKILRNENIEVVFNLAAICLPASLIKPKWVYDINVAIVSSLCELLRKDRFKTLIHFSSSEVYGNAEKIPMDENHPLKPTTPYGASKIACDHLILSYHKTFGVDVSIVRPFNVYGPRQNEGTYAGVIPLTIKRIMRGTSPVIYGDGLQTRDYTYVTDVVDAAVKVYRAKSTRGKAINIASGKEISIKELVFRIVKLMNCKRPIVYGRPRPGDVRRFVGDNSLAKKLIDYKPKVDLEQGLKYTIDWYINLFNKVDIPKM